MRLNPNTPFSGALGFNPKGVVVQNYTPFWLYFPQADQYCPPWTDGWTTPLTLNSNGYGYMQIQTPIGRTVQTNVTANIAQFVNLQWTDDDVTYSEGTPGDPGSNIDPGIVTSSSVSPITSQTHTAINISASTGVTIAPFMPAIPGKRYRLFGWFFTRNIPGPFQDLGGQCSALLGTPLIDIDSITLDIGETEKNHPLYGIDIDINTELDMDFSSVWNDTLLVSATVVYSIIG